MAARNTNKTMGYLWSLAGGRPAGFDNLRVILAFSVILWHTVVICYGQAAELPFWGGAMRPFIFCIIPSFFALSGFLVAGSLLRNDLLSFASLRLIRIYPALAFEVILSAFVIGTALTNLDLYHYFINRRFIAYLFNAIGWIHFILPGVFTKNAITFVNAQLWTVPFELECYLLLTILAFFGFHRKPVLFLSAAVGLTAAAILRMGITNHFGTPTGPMLELAGGLQPGLLSVLCFVFGVAIFLLRA